jgi:hypothetical protein
LGLVGGEHHPHRREHHIKRAVRTRQVFGIALAERHRQPLGRRACPPKREHQGGVVDADHVAPAAGRGQRRIATACRHIQDVLPRMHIDGLTEQLAHEHQIRADPQVIALRPCLLLAGLDGGEINHALLPPRLEHRVRRPSLDREDFVSRGRYHGSADGSPSRGLCSPQVDMALLRHGIYAAQ